MAAILPDWRTLTRQQLEAAVLNLPDVIDFGPGQQITSTQFVGVRHVGSGVVMEAPKQSGHHGVSDLLKGILGRKGSHEADLNLRAGDVNEYVHQDCSDAFDGVSKRSKIAADADLPTGGSKYRVEHTPAQELHGREELGSGTEMHTWEMVWKEEKAGGLLRRLKFVTSESGYKLIQKKLDAWATASHTSMAMNQAAKAALVACGGHLKENPGHQHDMDDFAHVKRSDGEAVDHIDGHVANFNHGRETEAGTLEDEAYLHKQTVIDMHSIQLQGKIQPHCDSSSSILKDGHIMAVAAVLPVRFRSYNWTLLYSTARDGISLNTLYRKVHMNGPSVLVVRDWDKHIFGCYASEEWKVTGRSYGSGECFVFQVDPDMTAYKWTRANHIFMISNIDMLAIGGGDHYSILLNSDLLTGYSGPCETFGSPCLASSEEFTVAEVEVWGFQ